MLAVDLLEDAGFETVEARNASEALQALRVRSDIQTVFTDVNMPGSMDGLQLAEAIRAGLPPLGLVITSGRVQPSTDELPARSPYLPKPYSGSKLLQALQAAEA